MWNETDLHNENDIMKLSWYTVVVADAFAAVLPVLQSGLSIVNQACFL